MNVEGMIENALDALTEDGIFCITQLYYDEENFGNVYVEVSSNNKVLARFIKDRGTYWCEIGYAGEWYLIEDIFTLLGVPSNIKSNDFINFISEIAVSLSGYVPQIFRAFSPKRRADTKTKIGKLAGRRSIDSFKQ